MPDAALTEAIKEAYASCPSSAVILHTLEFRHPAFSAPIRVVRDYQDVLATLELDAPVDAGTQVTFVAFAFDFDLPEVVTGIPSITITIDNVSRDIMANLDAAVISGQQVELTYRPYLSSDLTGPQMDPPLHLVVDEIDADVFQVTARATFGDLAGRKFPNELYTAEQFPGLVQA
jgi:hypothetical protein